MTPTDIFYILKKHKARTTFWVVMSLLVLIVINRAGAYREPKGLSPYSGDVIASPPQFSGGRGNLSGLSQSHDEGASEARRIGSVPNFSDFSLPVKTAFAMAERNIFIPLSSPLAGEGKGEGEQYIEGILPEETPKEEAFPYIFTGVIKMKGEQIAVLESTGNYKVHFKRKGEEISDMKVIEIDNSRLVLKSEEGKEVILDRKTK